MPRLTVLKPRSARFCPGIQTSTGWQYELCEPVAGASCVIPGLPPVSLKTRFTPRLPG
ncbi:hypothetical protein FA15DRAFT_669809 [Coprinopsis marcescibilis]|uniref:Uncharacterized protein n=1 Tax=Coprinopsis marcescibilis TaxID=230819 RepID=A0A5C3KWB5_COPMA|nr:hypothetical protein FA15DRAFT_669809 [Coprinopsis marcescibilis]